MSKLKVGAVSVLIAIGAVQTPRAQTTGTLVFVPHYDSQGYYETFGLALMQPDGSHQVGLTSDPTDREPTWSPDGSSIAFSRSSDLYVIPVTGGTPVNLTNHPALDGSPAWSPDGQRIAFASTAARLGCRLVARGKHDRVCHGAL